MKYAVEENETGGLVQLILFLTALGNFDYCNEIVGGDALGIHIVPDVRHCRASLYELLLVDNELELQAEEFGGLAAEQHSLHEYFEIVHYGAVMGVNVQLELYEGLFLVDFKL